MINLQAIIRVLIIILGVCYTLALQATQSGHYRWTDENGIIQYADRPPEGIESEFIKFTTIKRSNGGDENKDNELRAGSDSKIFDKVEVLPEKDPLLCKQAQRNLKALEGSRIRITEPDGSKRILSDDEKEAQRDNAKKFIKLHCN